MRERTGEEAVRRGQTRREKRKETEEMKKEAIRRVIAYVREVMVEELKEVKSRSIRVKVVLNVANQATLLLSVTSDIQGPSCRRMRLTTKTRLSTTLRGLFL